jgi:hypothetical protein
MNLEHLIVSQSKEMFKATMDKSGNKNQPKEVPASQIRVNKDSPRLSPTKHNETISPHWVEVGYSQNSKVPPLTCLLITKGEKITSCRH